MVQPNSILDSLARLVNELKLGSLDPQVNACRRQLQADGGVEVAVFGRFKAGKSSFLNHLAGQDVLPVGVVPLTAVITRLRFGPVTRAEVRFENGAARAIPLADIALYVAERENPDNRKQVAAVEVELPGLKELAPIVFVDTPGLGSALVHNTEATLRWLPNVGGALVAVSADAPLSERDAALIEQLRRHTPRIVLLPTKADLLTDPQRAEVGEFLRRSRAGSGRWNYPSSFIPYDRAWSRCDASCWTGCCVRWHSIMRRPAARSCGTSCYPSPTRSDYLRVGLAAAQQAESARALG